MSFLSACEELSTLEARDEIVRRLRVEDPNVQVGEFGRSDGTDHAPVRFHTPRVYDHERAIRERLGHGAYFGPVVETDGTERWYLYFPYKRIPRREGVVLLMRVVASGLVVAGSCLVAGYFLLLKK